MNKVLAILLLGVLGCAHVENANGFVNLKHVVNVGCVQANRFVTHMRSNLCVRILKW